MLQAKGPLVKFRILNTQGVALRDPVALKRIFQTGGQAGIWVKLRLHAHQQHACAWLLH